MKKLRVAVVMPTHFDIHSSLNNLLKVYSRLIEKRKIEVTIFTDKKNNVSYPGFNIEKISGIDYKTILEKILFVLGIPRFYYSDLIERLEGYDVIESSNPEFYGFAYQSYLAAKKYKSRLVYRTSQTVEGFYLFRFARYIVVPFARNPYDYAKFLLFTNPQAEQRCIKLGLIKNSKKGIIIGHATDTKCFTPKKYGKKGNSKNTILLSVGGLYRLKGHHIIMRALKKLVEQGFQNTELWIVGGGYYKKNLAELAQNLGISGKVKFLGKKNHEELSKIYNASDIFVLANYQEITPAVNEAMACEKPVVAMECGGCKFVIPGDDYGLVSKKFEADDMAKKIALLIKDKKLRSRIAKNGRKRVIKMFSVEKVAEKFYSAFTE